ncbi:MAG: ROK family protein [Casimicrobiaceae bacterium]
MIRLGVDLGGSKIEIVALAPDGRELFRRRAPTPQDGYVAVLDAIAALVGAAESALGAKASVGVGTPGSVSRATGLLRGSNSTCLNGKPIAADLAARLGREVRISNDANCFALSEATDGAAAGAVTVFGVILGTGVGAGIAVRGRALTGPNAIAGEWGHNPMPWPEGGERPGPPCFCGLTGCIETFLSGPGLEREHRQSGGETLAARDICAGADAGDAACEASLQRYEQRLARALAHVINILDPDVIVLGGGLSNMRRLYNRVPRLWCDWVFSDRVDTRLVAHRHGDSSGVRGAAWLWDEMNGDGVS